MAFSNLEKLGILVELVGNGCFGLYFAGNNKRDSQNCKVYIMYCEIMQSMHIICIS